jgi:hypothetical protein
MRALAAAAATATATAAAAAAPSPARFPLRLVVTPRASVRPLPPPQSVHSPAALSDSAAVILGIFLGGFGAV